MGISLLRAPTSPRIWLSLLALILVGWAGCKNGSHSVSSGLFIAPITVQDPSSVQVLAKKTDFLQAISPETPPSQLTTIPDSVVLGRLSTHTSNKGLLDDGVALTDRLLVYEGQSRSLLSVDLCPDLDPNCFHDVLLHHDTRGIDEDEGGLVGGVISRDVTPLQLKNGWILAYDSGSKNIVAFLLEPERQVRDAEGDPVLGPAGKPLLTDYRPFTIKTDKNFGRGNGLLLSVVISGEEMATEIKAVSEPIVTRLVEIEENKVLVFFSTTRDVHILNLQETVQNPDFDLNTSEPDHIPVFFLRGSLGAFKPSTENPIPVKPFLPASSIISLTGNEDFTLDSFQPILLPPPNQSQDPLLVFEQVTSSFLIFEAVKTNVNGEVKILGGTVRIGVMVLAAFQAGAQAGGPITGPLNFSGSFIHKNGREVVCVEEKTNNLVAFDPQKPANSSLRILVSSSSLSLRLDPSGTGGTTGQTEPVLVVSTSDVNDNRLTFDQGLDELISISYSSDNVVVVASRSKIIAATGNSLADLTYVEPLNNNKVRAFDSQSNALLSIELEYAAFPITVK